MTAAVVAVSVLERTVNSVSMTATIDRSSSSSSSSSSRAKPPTWTTQQHQSVLSPSASLASTPAAVTGVVVLACSPAPEPPSPPSSKPWHERISHKSKFLSRSNTEGDDDSNQTLQSKLRAARYINQKCDDDKCCDKKGELVCDSSEIEKHMDRNYPLCEYRKPFFDHLKIKNVITSTLRITIQQATVILAAFMSEQMEKDLKRNLLVNEGQLTQLEADVEAEEWEKIEWKKRWKSFPMKLATALTKYHAVTLILRTYEYVAENMVHVEMKTMDKLTMDPFKKSKRIVEAIEKRALPYGLKESVWDHKVYVVSTMTATTFWANLLSFCADYSLHQGLLCYGYYKYYNYKRQRRLALSEASPSIVDDDDDEFQKPLLSVGGGGGSMRAIVNTIPDDDKALAKDFAKQSVRLAANRNLGLICNAIGGGIGSIVWPGWGTVVFSALGDNIAGVVLDDGYFKALETLEKKSIKRDRSKKRFTI